MKSKLEQKSPEKYINLVKFPKHIKFSKIQ